MPLIINTNIASLNAQNNLSTSQTALQTSLQRLSSGLRINSAKDDAAGLAISTRMSSQINGLSQAARNANDGISMSQTASGALSTIADNLQRMRSLAVQAANGTNSASDRAAIQAEISQLQSNINQIATTTAFNGTNLLDGSLSSAQFQVGANANQTISYGIGNASANAIGTNALASGVAGGFGSVILGIAAGAFNATGNSNAASSQKLTITGDGATYTTPTASTSSTAATVGTAAGTAYQFAQMVNGGSSTTGVTATAISTATLGGFAAAGGNVSITLDGAPLASGVANPVTISASMANATDVGGFAAAINAQSGATGITAVADTVNGKIYMTQAQGYDIAIKNTSAVETFTVTGSSGVASAALGTSGAAGSSAVVAGQVSFNSSGSYTISSNLISTTGSIFNAAANIANGSVLSTVSNINVTTVTNGIPSGANNAISVIDGALATINASQAQMGAIQNRFTSVITNLNTTGQNLTASRSRIQDTDFAMETANLTRGQILQQAGTAMLAQANSLPNSVMALLK